MVSKKLFLQLDKTAVIRKAVIAYLILIIYALTILQDEEAYQEYYYYSIHCPECEEYRRYYDYLDSNLPNEEKYEFLESQKWQELSEMREKRIRLKKISLGLVNLVEYPDIFDHLGEGGINIRELIFILVILAFYRASGSSIWRIHLDNSESNHPYKDIINDYMNSKRHLGYIPFLREINLAIWKFDSDITAKTKSVNDALKCKIIGSYEAEVKISALQNEIRVKEAEYYFQYWADYANLKKAIATGVISKHEGRIKKDSMLGEFISSRVHGI
jgi:hypothetical protein